jgi:hypothetical protein
MQLDETLRLDERWRHGARHQEPAGVSSRSDADVAEPVEHALTRQDFVGGDERLDFLLIDIHADDSATDEGL